jgi:MATE family multidrug resistance protein
VPLSCPVSLLKGPKISTIQPGRGEPLARLRRHAGELLRLAAPVAVSRAGMMTLGAVDALMVGRHDGRELAFYGLGSVPIGILLLGGAGLLMGTVVMTATALGAGEPRRAGRVWRSSVPYALMVGLLFGLVCQFGAPLFRLLGQSPDLAEGGARVLAAYGWGMPGAMLFMTTAMFLEGIRRPVASMVAMILANLANVGLNWVLVYGVPGLPAMGAEGAVWGTTALRWLMALGLVAYALCLPERERFGIRGPLRGWWREGGAQRRLGYAAGASQGLESSAFASMGVFAGWLGAEALAAYTVGLNLIALPFMAAVGLSVATGVRVGDAYGRGDAGDVAWAGWTGLAAASALLVPVGLAYSAFPDAIAAAFSREEGIRAALAALVAFNAWILVADGGQVVMSAALRGRHDAWVPTALHFFSYFAVMIPVAHFLAFGMDHGVRGLFEGILVASLVSVSILAARFLLLGRRDALRRDALKRCIRLEHGV